MSAARNVSTKALRQVASASRQQVRTLHMTGTDTFPATLAATSRMTLSKTVATEQDPPRVANTRTFNTSRAHMQPKDTSTIDFAFLPTFPIPSDPNLEPDMRIPLLHSSFDPVHTSPMERVFEESTPVHRPIIITTSSDTTHISAPSPMAEVHDHTGMPDLPDAAIAVTRAVKEETKAAKGLVQEVWGGLIDDIFGTKQRISHA